jgi:hypothetical protein
MLRKVEAPAQGVQTQGRGEVKKKQCNERNTKRLARRQQLSWCRVLAAVAEQREALDFRIWLAEPNDTRLKADVQIWCALTGALADVLEAGRAA